MAILFEPTFVLWARKARLQRIAGVMCKIVPNPLAAHCMDSAISEQSLPAQIFSEFIWVTTLCQEPRLFLWRLVGIPLVEINVGPVVPERGFDSYCCISSGSLAIITEDLI